MGRPPLTSYTSRMLPLPVIIDTDPGIDDLVALTLALRAPQLRVTAITTSYGNAPLDQTTRNLRTLLTLLREDTVPVLPGADRPLRRALPSAPTSHGASGAGYATVPAAAAVPGDESALLRALERTTDAVTLITLGPLTNLARALRARPSLVHARVRQHLGMFGSLSVAALPDRPADSNSWRDPEAAAEVLAAGLPTTLVGLDVTHRMILSGKDISAFRASADPVIVWLANALQFAAERHRHLGLHDGCRVHDVLAVAEAIDPGLLTLAEHRLTVDFDEGVHRGRTVERDTGLPVAVAMDVDLTRTRALLRRVFPMLPSE